ncbi:hypothetical protein [Wolbachia endosymbiont of Mansonella ozzardi]|uniref:hypothetical protein n=1 Tax=Wolbachia endosymbiont of Mansonella ozzardi TaxID=137464 RepID=UPI001CE1E3B4|nr:hypothetical protein [Wolbachia endosymbiont of Mansonella ozzardi]
MEEEVLQPIVSTKSAKNLYDKMNKAENESKSVIERKEQEGNLSEIGKSIIRIINDIKNIEKQSLTVNTFKTFT